MHTGNVLIVDDDADIREMICLFVPRLGLEPTAVASGAAFRAAYERKTPDVVVFDIVLPGENGIDLLRWLAARGCRARVVVISGLASIHGPEARRVAEEVGIDIAVAGEAVPHSGSGVGDHGRAEAPGAHGPPWRRRVPHRGRADPNRPRAWRTPVALSRGGSRERRASARAPVRPRPRGGAVGRSG